MAGKNHNQPGGSSLPLLIVLVLSPGQGSNYNPGGWMAQRIPGVICLPLPKVIVSLPARCGGQMNTPSH